ncbi:MULTISPECIES: helix-turn-helix domain-containing protein, partial [unclassified Salmonella]|uniref:helix-turn-helix domain-containing protein n=1 Tax=unclassified Salmonella TaxID=2614656 RepID=UPI001F4A4AAB
EWVHVQLHQQKGMISLSPPTICNSASERIAELRQRVEAGEQKTKLAREFGISRETLYQYLRTDQ